MIAMSFVFRRIIVFEAPLTPDRLFTINTATLEELIRVLEVNVHIEIEGVAWLQEILYVLL